MADSTSKSVVYGGGDDRQTRVGLGGLKRISDRRGRRDLRAVCPTDKPHRVAESAKDSGTRTLGKAQQISE